jgi:leader peptidase (prepilin peptidase)/N-methyltransferase
MISAFDALALTALGLFGLVFGSLANVIIWRVPRGESIVAPRSRCPVCGHLIRWYDNIPVASWVLLRGQCRDCRAAISGRYPLVEALSGLLWLAAGLRFGYTASTIVSAVLFYLLLVLSFIDLDTYRLPNPIVGVLAVVGILAPAMSQLTGAAAGPLVGTAADGVFSSPLLAAVAGCALGAGVSAAIAGLYAAVRGRTGLGAGDVKLLGGIGLFTGPYVLMALGVGSIVGSIVGIVAAARSREPAATHRVPFGPFLAVGCVVTVLWGPALWGWYLGLVGQGF